MSNVTERWTEAQRRDYWEHRTGKKFEDIALDDVCPDEYDFDAEDDDY